MSIFANQNLDDTIRQHLEGWRSNPALRTLVDDYARYHVTLVVVGTGFAIGAGLLAGTLGRRLRRSSRRGQTWTTFEKRQHVVGAAVAGLVALSMSLLVVVNATTALNPIPGFSHTIGHPTPNSPEIDAELIEWIASGAERMPPALDGKIDDRIAWQRPKAILSGVVFVLGAALAVRLWHALVRRARRGMGTRRSNVVGLVAAECLTTAIGMLAMVMVVANTQGAIAPVAITLLGAGG